MNNTTIGNHMLETLHRQYVLRKNDIGSDAHLHAKGIRIYPGVGLLLVSFVKILKSKFGRNMKNVFRLLSPGNTKFGNNQLNLVYHKRNTKNNK